MTFRSLVFSSSLLGFLTNGALMAMDEEHSKVITTQSNNDLMEIDEENFNSNNALMAMDVENFNSNDDSSRVLVPCQFENLPNEIQTLILQKVVYQQSLENKSPLNIALVSTKWAEIVKDEMAVDKPSWKNWHGIFTAEHEAIYQTFLNGKLIYRPDPQNDEGKIELPIADLANPLEGEFDVSKCGNARQFVSINIGSRKGLRPENESKIEIWITPRFLVDRKLSTLHPDHYLRTITAENRWDGAKAPIGIFWTWGGWKEAIDMSSCDLPDCDYLTSQSMYNLGSETLSKGFLVAWGGVCRLPDRMFRSREGNEFVRLFHISFVNSNRNVSELPQT